MPTTDLVMHTIPTYSDARPVRTKEIVYSQKEIQWQRENISKLLAAGVISYCDTSPWSAQTKHPPKKDGTLRMVNIFCPVNRVTIKSNYPMRRIEPILNLLSQDKYLRGPKFQADAVNGYYTVPMWPTHAYKTAFSCSMGQFCYNVIGQGLSGAPHTYSRLKDIAMGIILAPNAEPSILGEGVSPSMGREGHGDVGFAYFMDNDYGAAETVEGMIAFLHHHYFPRLKWARLTLKPAKSIFFNKRLGLLGHESGERGLQLSADKIAKIRDYSEPTNMVEIEQLLYLAAYLCRFISRRAEHSRIMKEAVGKPDAKGKKGIAGKPEVAGNYRLAGKMRTSNDRQELIQEWKWRAQQTASFRHIKQSICENAIVGGDPSY